MFEPGKSGNPKGRPKKKKSLTEALEKELARKREGVPGKKKLAATLVDMALKGDVAAIRYIYDRCDGKPVEAVEVTDGDIDLKLKIILNGDGGKK